MDTTRAEDLVALSASSRSEFMPSDGLHIVLQEQVETDVERRVRSWTTVVSSPQAADTLSQARPATHSSSTSLSGCRASRRGGRYRP
jgi:hypothetical protein